MKRWLAAYDRYLKAQAEQGGSGASAARVHLVCLPYLLATIIVGLAFDAFSLRGAVTLPLRAILQLLFLIGLFVSGVRYLRYSHRYRQRLKEER